MTGACVRSLLEDARGEISAQARPLGASARVLGARGRRCDLWECQKRGGKTAGACATKGGREASKNARESKPDPIIRAKRVLGQRKRPGDGRRLKGG